MTPNPHRLVVFDEIARRQQVREGILLGCVAGLEVDRLRHRIHANGEQRLDGYVVVAQRLVVWVANLVMGHRVENGLGVLQKQAEEQLILQ